MIMIMSKIYQPIVLEQVESLILGLQESDFFSDYEIEDLTYVRQRLSDVLTEKFIDGSIDEDFEDLFSEDEFEQLLKELVAGSILYELKDKGLINSYEDENTEETFFLTEEGKEQLKDKDKLL
jgi:hypothetical protein